MSLNCNEIDLVLSELDLAGSFVQDVVQPSYDSIALYTYKPGQAKTVFISLAPGACRIHETRRKIPKNAKPLRFNELLKSRIKGARITGCRQLGKERIIRLELHKDAPIFVMPAAKEKLVKARSKSPAESPAQKGIPEQSAVDAASALSAAACSEEPAGENYSLYIRLWSNAANIFLCEKAEEGLSDGRNADDSSTDGSGTSPAADGSRAVIIDSFYRRPAKGETSGSLLSLPEAREQDKVWPVRDFAEIQEAVLENHPDLPEEKGQLSYSQKIDLFYSENAKTASLTSLLEQAEKWYNEHKSRQQAALERLQAKRTDFQNASRWKHQGDLILAYSYQIHAGDSALECEDYESGSTIRIKLDPKKSAQENAAAYYETYKKQTGGLEALEHDIARAEKALAELEAQYQRMQAEANPLKLEQSLRKSTTPKQLQKKTHPGLDYTVDGWQIIVGRDASENDELLRHHVKGMDMWLHTRDYAGGYVFIKNRPGKTVPLEILLYAGNLAVYYSKARKNAAADLYYTQVKHLRRAKDGPKGLVLPTHEKNLYIKLDEAKLRALEDLQTL